LRVAVQFDAPLEPIAARQAARRIDQRRRQPAIGLLSGKAYLR
jgi:hypothetical protein